MPGIIVAAGSFHQVIYQNNSFAAADTLLIEQAITTFFATASVEESSLNSSVIISPNPSSGEFMINFKNKEVQKTEISLYNLNGQLISEFLNETLPSGDSKIKMDLSRYPRGMYYINISNENPLKITEAEAKKYSVNVYDYFNTNSFGYFGTYTFEPDKGRVIHHVKGGTIPWYTDTEQPRQIRLKGDTAVIGDNKTWRRVLVRVK